MLTKGFHQIKIFAEVCGRLCITNKVCLSRYILRKRYSSGPALESIRKTIAYSGPMSVSQFMKVVLTDVEKGYYINKDMLGPKGDFITSPELNQMFGELLGIWCITEWKALGCPSKVRFVEFGPGRGTLANDIVQTIQHFHQKIFGQAEISFHFIEVSKSLSDIQYNSLCSKSSVITRKFDEEECYQAGVSRIGQLPMYWHRNFENVPNDCFTLYIAHEFFDALPIHKFTKTVKGWREVYVDIKPDTQELHFVQLPEVTLATRLIANNEKRMNVEVCPEAGTIISDIAGRIETKGGAALVIDYGHMGDKEDTLRGFKDHKLNEIFDNVGEADLTADVDFKYLMNIVKGSDITASGPIIQQKFLKNMGIEVRLMMLLRNCKDKEQAKKLVDSYKIMMDEKQMGERFKVMALTSKHRTDDSPVTGFYDT